MKFFLRLTSLCVLATALPQVAFPFNSQVPTAGRVGRFYSFQFAATTFNDRGSDTLTYTLADAPAWINLMSETRTLYGTPHQMDTGPNVFRILASSNDGSAEMNCTLVVAENNAPTVSGNISQDLARSGSLSGPTMLLLAPSDAFAITFSKSLFGDSPGWIQAYYATMSDHTPLPSWMNFDSRTLAFSGLTPVLATGSQTFTVDLIASDVVGFAGVIVTFTIMVTNSQFAFHPQAEIITINQGTSVALGPFLEQLSLNGAQVPGTSLEQATAMYPSWLTYQNTTLEFRGDAPSNFQADSVTINAIDKYGNTAIKNVYLQYGSSSSSLFTTNSIGNITATAGQYFEYVIPQSSFSKASLRIEVNLETTSWLHFNSSTLLLYGTPLSDASVSQIRLSLVASSEFESETRPFTVTVTPRRADQLPTSSRLTSRASPTNTSTKSSSATSEAAGAKDKSSTGIIIGIVIGCLALLALVFACAMLLCRRRRRNLPEAGRTPISRPIVVSEDRGLMVSRGNQEHRDLEKAISPTPLRLITNLSMSSDPPAVPRDMLDVRRARQSIQSGVSSIGEAEATIEGDSNIPIWGRQSEASHTPHHSYSAATDLARRNSRASNQRLSDFGRLSPRKRASAMLRNSRQLQRNAEGSTNKLGSVIHCPDRRSRMSDLFSVGRDRSSTASFDTHGTSMLSTKRSEFPPSEEDSQVPTTIALTDAQKRCSIRVVSRTESLADPRPLWEKRQSFIRNRASSSITSPLFASSRRSSNPALQCTKGSFRRANGSIRKPTHKHDSRVATSTSSILELPARNPRRLASAASGFLPNFTNISSPTRKDRFDHTTIQNHDENSTEPGSYSSLTRDNSSSLRANKSLAADLLLPRHERDWVLPNEASPTPPPVSLRHASAREDRRRQWAEKLNRNSHGSLRPPSPLRSQLRGVSSQGLQCRKERLKRRGEDKENDCTGGDSLSKLISSSSVSGVKIGRRSNILEAPRLCSSKVGLQDAENDSEWEDVNAGLHSPGKPIGSVLARVNSNSSGVRAFI